MGPDFGVRQMPIMIIYLVVFRQAFCSRFIVRDKNRLLMGLPPGGLAAVYSLFHFDKVSCIFSICGSLALILRLYCREEKVKNLLFAVFTEWLKQKEPIIPPFSQAPAYAEQIHTSLQETLLSGSAVCF